MENFMKKFIFALPVVIVLLLIANPAFAAAEVVANPTEGRGLIGLAAGLAIGMAALGGALGQGNTAKAALEAIGRNPNANVLVPMVLGLALIESLVIYGMVVAFQLLGKL
jgi:F-type H+-transporting ATPase subunit c